MDEGYQTITYDENWQTVSEPEIPVAVASEKTENREEPPRVKQQTGVPRQLLPAIRLVVCILLAVAAFALKNIGGEVYQSAREWYFSALNSTVLFEDRQSLEGLFGAATADEA